MDEKAGLNHRRTELDLLRLTALLCVVGLHVGSTVWKELPLWTAPWLTATLLRATWAVPVFVMLSGRFLLDPEKTPRLGRYLARVGAALVFWGVVYQLFYLAVDWEHYNWKRFAAGVFTGAYHMWYLWMLLGLYALTPLLRPIAGDRRLTEYFLLLHILWQILSYFVPALPVVGNTVSRVLPYLDLSFAGGFPGYYLLGWYLHAWQPTRKQKRRLYGIALLCWGICILGNLAITRKTGENTEFFTRYPSPLLMIQAAAVFVLFEKDLAQADWAVWVRKLAAFAGRYGFGAYLSHALVNAFAVRAVGETALAENPLLWITTLACVVTAVSFGLSWLLGKLPGIGGYIA